MATIKSYTSVEQSRKLAGILPIESADMFWADSERPAVWNNKDISLDETDIPCWSLAALLGQMICPKLENYVRNSWDLDAAMDDTLQRWLSVQDCPTAVDACVEMILKMHEQKLL